MAKNQTYKAFTVYPSHVLDLNGVLLDSAPVLAKLATEVRGISAYATYTVRNDTMQPIRFVMTRSSRLICRRLLFLSLRLLVVEQVFQYPLNW